MTKKMAKKSRVERKKAKKKRPPTDFSFYQCQAQVSAARILARLQNEKLDTVDLRAVERLEKQLALAVQELRKRLGG